MDISDKDTRTVDLEKSDCFLSTGKKIVVRLKLFVLRMLTLRMSQKQTGPKFDKKKVNIKRFWIAPEDMSNFIGRKATWLQPNLTCFYNSSRIYLLHAI